MRLLVKRRLLIKISLALLLIVCAVPFLLSKPRGQENVKKAKPAQVKHDALQKSNIPGAVFHAGTLGNFEPKNDFVKYGPGESGKSHHVAPDRQNEARQGMMEFGINVVASDEISMNRTIPDTRLEECKYWEYPEDLPKTSVIIVFHNEGWSPLLRTVHSVLNRSPPQFLEEVLLVDDFSDKDHLKGPLDDYIRQFNGKVRLIRNVEREGLIRTRSKGAQEARGEVILFLDAHCEVNTNWLPPLLTPIYQNRRMMTVPVIDGVDRDTLEYRPVYSGKTQFRGIFEWGMLYKETKVPTREAEQHEHVSEPYRSPTHAGGLFAMNREYFLELGAYDPGLLVWGGENFELSFKIWQCGGGIVWVPCSRVGHIYRAFMPYNFGKLGQKKKGPLITLNYKRVVEVWMDEYAEYFYTREPLAQFLDIGDITKQLELRQRLKCKSFRWFMDNVAYDVPDSFPVLPKNLHWGELQQHVDGIRMCWDSAGNLGEELPKTVQVSPCFEMDESDPEDQLRNVGTGQCLDSMGSSPPRVIGVSHCHGLGSNQLFRLNAEGQLGVGERCIDANSDEVKLIYCSLGTVDGPWKYDDKTHMLQHTLHQKCVELLPQNSQLKLSSCDDGNDNMKWKFAEVHPRY